MYVLKNFFKDHDLERKMMNTSIARSIRIRNSTQLRSQIKTHDPPLDLVIYNTIKPGKLGTLKSNPKTANLNRYFCSKIQLGKLVLLCINDPWGCIMLELKKRAVNAIPPYCTAMQWTGVVSFELQKDCELTFVIILCHTSAWDETCVHVCDPKTHRATERKQTHKEIVFENLHTCRIFFFKICELHLWSLK